MDRGGLHLPRTEVFIIHSMTSLASNVIWQAGPRYVPLLRISLLQMEMVLQAIYDGTAVQKPDNKVLDEANKEALAVKRVSR